MKIEGTSLWGLIEVIPLQHATRAVSDLTSWQLERFAKAVLRPSQAVHQVNHHVTEGVKSCVKSEKK